MALKNEDKDCRFCKFCGKREKKNIYCILHDVKVQFKDMIYPCYSFERKKVK